VKHYRTHRENWEGGFSRNEEADAKALAVNPLPSDLLEIQNLKVNGHDISYRGKMNLSFRTGKQKRLLAFIGKQCRDITIDDIAYIPLDAGLNKYRVRIDGEELVALPIPDGYVKAILKDGEKMIECKVNGRNLVFNVDRSTSGRWMDLTYR